MWLLNEPCTWCSLSRHTVHSHLPFTFCFNCIFGSSQVVDDVAFNAETCPWLSECSLIETSSSFTPQINFLALAVRGATSDCFTRAVERWGGAYLFSNVSSYALEAGQLGRNGSIRNAGGRACFFSKEKFIPAESYIMYFMRQKLFTMYYYWVSFATSRMVYHVCIGSLVKAMRVHEYLMWGMHQWFVLLPPRHYTSKPLDFSLKTNYILLHCVRWFCWLIHFLHSATGAVEASIS